MIYNGSVLLKLFLSVCIRLIRVIRVLLSLILTTLNR